MSTSQDFRCSNGEAGKNTTLAPSCYCYLLRAAPSDHTNQRGEPSLVNATRERSLYVTSICDRQLETHKFEEVQAFAYVTIGPLANARYEVLKLEIVGPADPDPSHRVMRYREIESVFIPMQLTPDSFAVLQRKKLV